MSENIARNANKMESKGSSVEKTYVKKTQLEHILLRPDSYIGSVQSETNQIWVYNEATKNMQYKTVTYVPGLYKIIDEILVNAADHKQRDPAMDTLKITIDRDSGTISVFNNGTGIPVEMHKVEKVFVPELIFGHLLTSSNYDDSEKRTVGGRNGFGAKLTNIFSKRFVVETADSKRGLKFEQTYSDNMTKRTEPSIVKSKADYTRITFVPDFEKFGMLGLDNDIIALIYKRCFDIAGTAGKGLKVFLNDEHLKVKNFKQYIEMYLGQDEEKHPRVHERVNDRWEVGLSISDGHFQQVSFVNGIATSKGGNHVKYVTDQVTDKLVEFFEKKHKKLGIKAQHIKNYLFLFVNCLIENPTFDSQSKETMTKSKKDFGSDCPLSDEFFAAVLKSGLVDQILSWANLKQNKDLKKSDGKKKGRISGIPKLDDANEAGSKTGHLCTLILTEGDSAKALAVSGLSVLGRDRYGVFPLKGKLLNVRDASTKQVMGNEEVTHLKQILGLKQGAEYEDTKSLRYGHVMLMTDQDHDGSHIKGLVINMFSHFWPSLLKIPGFLVEFITPIVKCTKGSRVETFYTMPEYQQWKETAPKGYKIKYYKGLGTSTAKEGKEYFSQLDIHQIDFVDDGDQGTAAISMAFSKKGADARKEWIERYVPGSYLDVKSDPLTYSNFVNKELILFSITSNQRAIPSMVDGLKPGQRKILFACLKRKLNKEIKVAQLAGYVSADTAYHHGEVSLTATIVGMAQNYVGSNNINLLMPNGQFGTRSGGGKDAASARYIFTQLAPVTRAIFPEDDDKVLHYLDEDGMTIEPEWYMPVLPMVLVNGSSGIGTGWSSDVPNFNPRDIAANLLRMIDGNEPEPMHPWYKGFTGQISPKAKGSSYEVKGIIETLDETGAKLRITELPIEKWTTDFKIFLEDLLTKGYLKDFKEHHLNETVDFLITLAEDKIAEVQAKGLYKFFKLTSSKSTSNMVLFDKDGRLKKYPTAEAILKDFFPLRLEFYSLRKQHLVKKLTEEVAKLQNRVRFILAVISEELVIKKVKKDLLVADLVRQKYTPMPKGKSSNGAREANDESSEEEKDEDDSEQINGKAVSANDYDYLLSMPLWSLTFEKVEALKAEKAEREKDLEILLNTDEKTMWKEDIQRFLEALDAHELQEQEISKSESALMKKKSVKGKKSSKVCDDDDDDYKKPVKPKKLASSKQKPSAVLTEKPKSLAPAQLTQISIAAPASVSAKPAGQKLTVAKGVKVQKSSTKDKARKRVSSDDEEDDDPFEPLEDEDEFLDIDEKVSNKPPVARPSRQKKVMSYAGLEDDLEDDVDREDEDEAPTTKKAKHSSSEEKQKHDKFETASDTSRLLKSNAVLKSETKSFGVSSLAAASQEAPLDLAARLAKRMASVHQAPFSSLSTFASKSNENTAFSTSSAKSGRSIIECDVDEEEKPVFKPKPKAKTKASRMVLESDQEDLGQSESSEDEYEPSPEKPKKRKPIKPASEKKTACLTKRPKKSESTQVSKAKAKPSEVKPKKMKSLFSKSSSKVSKQDAEDLFEESKDTTSTSSSAVARPKRAVKQVVYCENSDGDNEDGEAPESEAEVDTEDDFEIDD